MLIGAVSIAALLAFDPRYRGLWSDPAALGLVFAVEAAAIALAFAGLSRRPMTSHERGMALPRRLLAKSLRGGMATIMSKDIERIEALTHAGPKAPQEVVALRLCLREGVVVLLTESDCGRPLLAALQGIASEWGVFVTREAYPMELR